MAEAVARYMRLDAAGIDFISPDITKSWRDGECAIIEINGRPGIASHFLAERVFSAKFPEGSNGRIPCMLVIDDEDALAAAVAERLKGHGTRVGFAGNKTTSLAGDRRFIHGGDLPTRILSLLFDPGCDALVVACRAADIENHGLPHARFDVALLAEPLTPELRALATDHVANCIDVPSKGDIGAVADAAIAALRR
jgi:cyanophycin synthetase